MNLSMINAYSALTAQQFALDTAANHMANLHTPGFKRQVLAFQDVLRYQLDQPYAVDQLPQRLSPAGIPWGGGVNINGTAWDWSLGVRQETNRPLDVMLEMEGFFRVQDDFGQEHFTRNGNLQLSILGDGQMTLILPSGERLLDRDTGEPIQFPSASEVKINPDGGIMISQDGDDFAATDQALSIAQIAFPQVLESTGFGRYGIPAVLAAQEAELIQPLAAEQVQLRSGVLEGSNVDLTVEITRVMQAQRAYQMNAQALASSDRLMEMANMLRG